MGELKLRGQRWWIRYYRNGRRYEEPSGSKRKGDAQRLLQLREGAIAKGEPVSPTLQRFTFDDAMKLVVDDYTLNERDTLAQVQRRIRLHLAPMFGGRRLTAITAADVTSYQVQRRKAGAKNATINRELAILKRGFTLARQAGKTLAQPHIAMLEERNARKGFFELAAFEAVRAKLPAEIQPVATMAYFTGWRVPSEILTRQWRHVDRVHQALRLEPNEAKNDDGRTFPYGILPELVEVIDHAWAERCRLAHQGVVCPWVFHRTGKPIRTFYGAWEAACKAAGVPGRIPHDFRRTSVRNLVRAGVSEKVAMTLTGHKTRSVFDRYDIVNEADLHDAVGKLAGTKKGQSAGSEGATSPGASS